MFAQDFLCPAEEPDAVRVYRWLLLLEREASECQVAGMAPPADLSGKALSQPTSEDSLGGQPFRLLGAHGTSFSLSLPPFKGRARHKHMRLAQAFSY